MRGPKEILPDIVKLGADTVTLTDIEFELKYGVSKQAVAIRSNMLEAFVNNALPRDQRMMDQIGDLISWFRSAIAFSSTVGNPDGRKAS